MSKTAGNVPLERSRNSRVAGVSDHRAFDLPVVLHCLVGVLATVALLSGSQGDLQAQEFGGQRRATSPAGRSATQIGGVWDARSGWVNGRWIEIRYGRPLKRGREIFSADDFVEFLNDGAEVWRAGANYTTVLETELPLLIGGVRVDPGEYTVFIELAADEWTFILSTWPAQVRYDEGNREALFGAYEYTPDRDLVRVPMVVEELPWTVDQLAWQFLDVQPATAPGPAGGTLALLWDRRVATVAFTVIAEE